MNWVLLGLVSLNLAATGTVAVIAFKVAKRLDKEVDAIKSNTNDSLTHIQDAVGAMKF